VNSVFLSLPLPGGPPSLLDGLTCGPGLSPLTSEPVPIAFCLKVL